MIAGLVLAMLAGPVTAEPLGPDHFRLKLESTRAAHVEAAQAEMMPEARRLCGAKPPSFGTFRFQQLEKTPGAQARKQPVALSLEQELFCGSAPKLPDRAGTVSADWQPSEADQRAILAATYAYFAAKDRGRHAEAYAMLSPGMKRISPSDEWRRDASGFAVRSGQVRSRRVTELTWYNSPPGAPQPGLYVAADFSAEFEHLEFLCGYVVWVLQPDGSFALSREEQNLLDRATAKNLASIDRKPLRAQMGCKD
jgi:hypothetical protein